jgi:hypothetical protein
MTGGGEANALRSAGPIGLAAIVRNEAAGLAEWIAYHLAIGFDSILIYDHRSTDDTKVVAAQMAQVGDVRCVDWRSTSIYGQIEAYDEALDRFGPEFEWLFFLDADEFLLPLAHDSIRPLMAGYQPDVSAVAFHWQFYGSSGLTRQPEGLLMIEAFQRHSYTTFEPSAFVKSAVRPHRTLGCESAHAFVVDGRYVLADGTDVEWSAMSGVTSTLPTSYAAGQVNHYYSKSRSQWEAKVRRGSEFLTPEFARTLGDFVHYDRNELVDGRILQHRDATRALMAAAGCLRG